MLLFWGGLALTGFSQTAKNVNLVGHLTNPALLNDCWGYVAPDNSEYALIGIQTGGMAIVNITNPASPVLLQTIPGVPSTWRDLKTFGHYAYVVNDDGGAGGNGLLVIDLSNLPGTCAYKDTIIHGTRYSHNIYMDAGYLYVAGGHISQGFEVYDLNADPWRPNYVGNYTAHYSHDVYVRNNLAYSCELGNGLTILDVSNKSSITTLGNQQYVGNFTHNSWLNDAGNVCFTTDEVAGGWIYAWDVSDPNNIEYLDGIRSSLSNEQAIPHNTHVKDDFLVTSYYRDGMHIVDAARPHNLIEVGYYDTSPLSGDGFDGDWGAYPFFPSGTVITSDMNDGLFIFNVDYKRGCYLEGIVRDSITALPISGAQIDILTTSISSQSGVTGEYATGVADSGTYQVRFRKFGYADKIITVTLDNGVLFTQNVLLAPLARVNYTFRVLEAGTLTPIPNAKVVFHETVLNQDVNYTANANGEVNDPSFVQGTYEVLAGKWGWRTAAKNIVANTSNTSETIELDRGYYDDFVLDFGWNVGGGASAGIWERGEPNGTTFFGFDFNPDEDINGDFGDQCYVTGNGGGNAGDDDVDNGVTILTTPTMDLTQYNDPVVQYYRWFANGGGNGNINDTLIIQIDNGFGFTSIEKIKGGTSANWTQSTFTLSQFAQPTSSTRIRFVAGDYGDGHLVEAAVDVFEILEGDPNAVEDFATSSVDLTAYPNPMVDHARIVYDLDATPDNAELVIRDMMGRVVYQRELNSRTGSFRVSFEGASGLYTADLRNAGVSIRTFKIVK